MAEQEDKCKIQIKKNGPYIVSGKVPLDRQTIVADENGVPSQFRKGKSFPEQDTYALCRCGGSGSKPYCDGTHERIGFNGTETASKKEYQQRAEFIYGPELKMADDRELCSGLRFCHKNRGAWTSVEESDIPEAKKDAVDITERCASGRLTCYDKEGKAIEAEHEKSISVIEDPTREVSGPLWVRGGIPVHGADEAPYEVRNRVTLCRCGRSRNKPYCDSSHVSTNFDDGSIDE
jgi:CDGSH-type Zn-finger protein